MAETYRVRPAKDGKKVPLPGSTLNLPRWGADVERSDYWDEQLAAGVVVLVPPGPQLERAQPDPSTQSTGERRSA